jgi:hypothetical protein
MSDEHHHWGQQPGAPAPGAAQTGWSPGPAGQGRRVDALDVIEGVLTNGFSLSSFTRVARAKGSSFWIGAAIGAGLIVLMNRPEVRTAAAGIFSKAGTPPPAPEPAVPSEPGAPEPRKSARRRRTPTKKGS